jgi:glycine oxidase
MKVIIVGAGIAGMAIAWRLAQAGADVALYDRGLAGRGATWAAAGMIAPGAELKDESEELSSFARRSRAAWPGFAAELEAESGCSIGYGEPGSLIVALDDARAGSLRQHDGELGAEWIEPTSLRQREPLVSPDLCGALYMPGDAQVDNRSAAEALRIALARRNVAIHESTEIRGLLVTDNRVHGVILAAGTAAADAVIVASGAWLNEVGGASAELPPVAPVKGQMIALEPSGGTALPKHLVWGDDVYMVPRRGRLLIGATVEDAGFDTSVSADVCARLVSAAARIIPALREWSVSEMWAGLRPRTPDGAPVLGASNVEGLYVAGGQFRNGILFAPAVADAMQQIVLTSQSPPDFRSFDPRRFNPN